jgi:uncharacterized protein (TIGR03437 family)
MRNFLKAALAASLLFASTASAVPTIPAGGIVNNASYLATGLPGDGIARGSMFAVFGTELGPAEFTGAPSLPLGTTLGGTSISVTVNGVTRSAFMLFSVAGQLAAVLPSDLPAGNGTLTVTYNGMASALAAIKVVDSAFGIFSRNQAGFGPGIVQNYVSQVDQPVNAITDAAHPGQVVILWGTGLGPISGGANVDAGPPPVGNLPVTVEVWVGGKAAAVQYAGRSSGYAAIDQINFAIPAGVTGCYVPVVVVVNGVVSNYVTIAITETGPYCSDFQTFLPGELATFVQNGEGGFGFAEMARYRGTITTSGGSENVIVDDFNAEFYRMTVAELVKMTPSREGTAPLGACISNRYRAIEGANNDPTTRVVLSVGPELQLQGPQGMKLIGQNGERYEGNVGGGFGGDILPEFYTPGAYVLKGGSQATDIGAFGRIFPCRKSRSGRINPGLARSIGIIRI